MGKLKKSLGVILAVAVIAGGIYFIFFNKGPAGAKTANEATAAPGGAPGAADPNQKIEAAPMPVKTVAAAKGDLIMTLKSPGEAYTEKKIVLKAEVGGMIKNLAAVEGRHVKNGDILVELDDRELRLKLDRLEAQRLKALSELYLEKQFASAEKEIPPAALEKLKKAQSDYDKASEDFRKGLIASPALEHAQKELELALIEAGRKKDEIMASSKNLTQGEIDVKLARMDHPGALRRHRHRFEDLTQRAAGRRPRIVHLGRYRPHQGQGQGAGERDREDESRPGSRSPLQRLSRKSLQGHRRSDQPRRQRRRPDVRRPHRGQ
jgi:multidrug efflux pump subunit AcrA (membrane-fusion protein)